MTEYAVASWLVTKSLCLCYFVAFLSLLPQVLGLYGRQGILSLDHFLNLLDKELGAERFHHVPSLFWFLSNDFAVRGLCFIGMVASSLAFLGFSQSWMLLICWICYLSYVSCGQVFLGYQWDSLLLEFGFLGLFFAPWTLEWSPMAAYHLHPFVLGLVWLLLFKLMFLSGVVKLKSRDPAWTKLTALSFHYWTQPLPSPLAYFFAKLPMAIQRISTFFMFFIELIVPFFIFAPGPLQVVAALFLFVLQVLIWTTGNYGFFNILTIGLIFSLLPDSALKTFDFGEMVILKFDSMEWISEGMIASEAALLALMILVPATLFWITKTLSEKSTATNFMLPMMRLLYPYRISNPYGLFAVMTKVRPELVLEGSLDGETWLPYELKNKPTDIKKRPRFVAPHQPRLDWQMWFAALESFNENLWLQNLITRIFESSPDVLSLFRKDPFGGKPPKYLRLLRYEFHFSSWKDLRTRGEWWTKELIAPYGPVFEREDD